MMLYPLKFEPVYKNYLWGGRELASLGKNIPEGIVAESWEASSHPDGESVVSNCEYGKNEMWYLVSVKLQYNL
jgi:mannose-6-phosphate isomerase